MKDLVHLDEAETDYSVVVPFYNEKGNIAVLHNEIKSVMSGLSKNYDLIYVNDGSTDGSFEELKGLKGATIINLNRNYGQSIALDAGFKAAKGRIIISLDGDGQNDPKDIPKLIEKLKKSNLDVVAGWRKKRKDKSGIRLLTRTGRLFRRILIKDGVHDTGCTLRVYRREAAKSLDLWGEMHRYILALLRWKGFKIGEVEVNHRARKEGKTKYGYDKAYKGFIDLVYIWFLNKYSNRPMHMFGFLGLLSFFIGVILGGWTLYDRIFGSGLSLNRNGWFFIGFFLLILGVLFFSFGILMDLMIRTNFNSSPYEKRYYVSSVVRN